MVAPLACVAAVVSFSPRLIVKVVVPYPPTTRTISESIIAQYSPLPGNAVALATVMLVALVLEIAALSVVALWETISRLSGV